ncbi:MAG TPA: UPF0149 family protein [Candidatus Acidoferrum sp.]|nr:UPF0149 family protein [Candidatus Acidoferrum sp.]
MAKNSIPLSDDELDDLQDLLVFRIPEDEDTEGRDEGVVILDELDGFLTALVSGPIAVLPSVWLKAVWGDYPPQWESADEQAYFMQLVQRLQTEISSLLNKDTDNFEPMFSWHELEDQPVEIVDDWCEGYLRGVRVLGTMWEAGHPDVSRLLEPLRAFSSETDWQGYANDIDEADAQRAAIVPNIRELYRYWKDRRGGVARL